MYSIEEVVKSICKKNIARNAPKEMIVLSILMKNALASL